MSDTKIGDILVAASDERFGILVVGYNFKTDDFVVKDLKTGAIRDIDAFKMSYRYKKIGSLDAIGCERIPQDGYL